MSGRTLSEAIAQGLPLGRVLELGEAIADALAAAHRKRVTHRDLKPDNIMIDGDGRPKVLDSSAPSNCRSGTSAPHRSG